MKRFLLGLIMVGSFALAAAPMANAQNAGLFCGHNYAFQVVGAEPVTATGTPAQTFPLNYIGGVGVLQFGALGSAGAGNCTVGGEMVYVDDDYETFMGGPQNCATIPSVLNTLPCFSGDDTLITGGTGPGPNGSNTLQFAAKFPAVVGAGNHANITLPFAFTIFTTKFASTLIGNSNIPPGGTGPGQNPNQTALYPTINPNPCPPSAPVPPGVSVAGCGPNAPPVTNQAAQMNGAVPGTVLGPVLSFIAQEQSTASSQIPVPTVYGAAPYSGEAAFNCSGFGGNQGDLAAAGTATQPDEPTGTYGTVTGSINVFSVGGLASGSVTSNSNDQVGNTTGLSNYDCDLQQKNTDAWGDGTNDDLAIVWNNQFNNPYTSNASLSCLNATAGLAALDSGGNPAPTPQGAFQVNSGVVWGSTNQNGYTIITGVASPLLGFAGNPFVPPGETTTCLVLAESGSTKVTVVKPANPLIAMDGATTTEAVSVTDNSESACTITATMPTVTGALSKGTHPGQCTISLLPQAPFDGPPTSGVSPISFGVESFTGTNPYVNIKCTCTSSTSEDGGVTATAKSTISFSSPNCSLTAGTSQLFTCEN